LAYKTGFLSGLFLKVLGDKDLKKFKDACIYSILIILGMVVVKSLRQYSGKILIVCWRQKLCLFIHELYLKFNASYKLLVFDESKMDNPDQRITSDVNSLTSSYGKIVSDLVLVPVLIGYYTYDAYNRAGWLGPTAMYAYFLISTVVNKVLMGPAVRLTVKMERKEGDFRFKHMELRTHSESLALSGSEKTELQNVNEKLSNLCKVQKSLYDRNLPIDLSVNLFNYFGAILSYVVIAVPIFSGVYDNLDSGDLTEMISNTAFVCMYLVFQLTQLVNITSSMAGLAGSTHRVTELLERLNFIRKDSHNLSCISIASMEVEEQKNELLKNKEIKHADVVAEKHNDDVLFTLENVSLKPPGWEKDLIHNLNLVVTRNSNLLIIGQSGCGKSSLVRVMKGIWPHDGVINTWLEDDEVIFLAQSPFLSSGSMMDQVTYPEKMSNLTTDEKTRVQNLMTKCQLTSLMARHADLTRDNWYSELSPGEQQRLAWARLLYHNPRLAVLDEATSGVSEDIEALMYGEAIKQGMTLVSVGHRGSLRTYHDKILVLGEAGTGTWSLGTVENYCSQGNLFVSNSPTRLSLGT